MDSNKTDFDKSTFDPKAAAEARKAACFSCLSLVLSRSTQSTFIR